MLSPCAMGGAINTETIKTIQSVIIAGGANNQLQTEEMGHALSELGILYAPDYVINAGGIIDCYYQTVGKGNSDEVREHIDIIAENLKTIFAQSKVDQRATSEIADEMALSLLKN